MAVIDNNWIDYSYNGYIYNLFSQLENANIILNLYGNNDSTYYDVNNLYLDDNYYIGTVTSLSTALNASLESYGLETYKLPKISAGSFTTETNTYYSWQFSASDNTVVIDGDFIAKSMTSDSVYRFDKIFRIAIFIYKPI